MMTIMVLVFLIGYLMIAMEHPLKVNKAGTALLLGAVLWVMYMFAAPTLIPDAAGEDFKAFVSHSPSLVNLPYVEQCVHFVVDHQILNSVGEISTTLIFLIGAMTIVELIDAHGGFNFITRRVTARDKRRLLVMVSIMTFFMSAVLDNLTTSIVMIMLIRKIVGNYRERWIFGSMIVIAANSGGAWSPIGDASVVSALIPLLLLRRFLKGDVTPPRKKEASQEEETILRQLSEHEKLSILILGVLCLLFVPVFKMVTHLPPFMGILLGVGFLWFYTELMYAKINVREDLKLRLSKVVHRIDGSTLLFFLGILLAVDALKCGGILAEFARESSPSLPVGWIRAWGMSSS